MNDQVRAYPRPRALDGCWMTGWRRPIGICLLPVMRMASQRFSREFLQGCTLYASTEPCVMCAGAIYWGNVRKVVFALGEDDLRDMVGANPDSSTLALPCRDVFARGQHEVDVSGPHIQEQARAVHEGFWA